MNSTTLALLNDIFTGVYVFLTLIIAGATIWSLFLTRASLKLTRDQIEVNRKQSEQALETSEKQAREALINQQKPVIVPTSGLSVYRKPYLTVDMQNKGIGIAMNTWGILYNKETQEFLRLLDAHFLVPDKLESIELVDISGESLDFLFPTRMFNSFSIYPADDNGKLDTTIRLMMTYNDVFDNKYLVIFDWSRELGWRQIEGVKKIDQRLDEYFVEKRANADMKVT